jgi:hypothetical protein
MIARTLEHLEVARDRIRCWRLSCTPKYGILPVIKVRWLLDVTEQRVSELMRDGKLARVDFYSVVCVTEASVIAYDQNGRDWGGQRIKPHGNPLGNPLGNRKKTLMNFPHEGRSQADI